MESGEWSSGPGRWAGVVLLVVALAAGGIVLATRPAGQIDVDLPVLPAFSLRGFDGMPIRNRTLAGKPGVINFFASTCPFCIHEMPAFERVHARRGDDVTFLGVALRDSQAAARQLAEQTGVTYRLAFDETGDFYRSLRGVGMPVTVFVRADGRIASTHAGRLDEVQLEQTVDELLVAAGTRREEPAASGARLTTLSARQ